jgi:hypothetical protein
VEIPNQQSNLRDYTLFFTAQGSADYLAGLGEGETLQIGFFFSDNCPTPQLFYPAPRQLGPDCDGTARIF